MHIDGADMGCGEVSQGMRCNACTVNRTALHHHDDHHHDDGMDCSAVGAGPLCRLWGFMWVLCDVSFHPL
jgi:hypothetical protein